MSNPDRLDIEAMREAVYKSEMKVSNKVVENANKELEKCQEIWDKDFEVLILTLRKVIADKVPQNLRSIIVRQCVKNIIALLTPIETAGILGSITSEMFDRKISPVIFMGGSAEEKLLKMKGSNTGKSTSVV